MSVEVLVVVAIALAALAAVRRLARTAVVLVLLAGALGAGPTLIDGASDRLGGLGAGLLGVDEDGERTYRAEVVDGDTIRLRGLGERLSVRVALLDAGESSSSRYGRPTCGGRQGRAFARRWVARRYRVRLRPVRGLPRSDRYDRRLGRVIDSRGRDYGRAIVAAGWARVTVYEQPHGSGARYLERLRRLERQARRSGAGAWGACDWANRDGVR